MFDNSPVITSTRNPRIVEIRSLRMRKRRDQRQLAYVEGLRATVEAINSDAPIRELIICPELLTSAPMLERIEASSYSTLIVSEPVFRALSKRDGPQGFAAVVQQSWNALEELEVTGGNLWIALDSIADAGNIGTILRSCEATGVAGIIFVGNTADPYDPVAIRASTGAIFSQTLIRTEWSDLIAWANSSNVKTFGTSGTAIQDYRQATYASRNLVVMGAERSGLANNQLEQCDQLLSIPMRGQIDSLNVASAATLVLYEFCNNQSAWPS